MEMKIYEKMSMFFVFLFMFALVTTVSAASFEPTNHEVLMLNDQQPPDMRQPQPPPQNQPHNKTNLHNSKHHSQNSLLSQSDYCKCNLINFEDKKGIEN